MLRKNVRESLPKEASQPNVEAHSDKNPDARSDEPTDKDLLEHLLPDEKEELDLYLIEAKLEAELLDMRVKDALLTIKTECNSYCSKLHQICGDEITIRKRSSIEVLKEFDEHLMATVRAMDRMMKKVATRYEESNEAVKSDYRRKSKELLDRHRRELETRITNAARQQVPDPNLNVCNSTVFYVVFAFCMLVYITLVSKFGLLIPAHE